VGQVIIYRTIKAKGFNDSTAGLLYIVYDVRSVFIDRVFSQDGFIVQKLNELVQFLRAYKTIRNQTK